MLAQPYLFYELSNVTPSCKKYASLIMMFLQCGNIFKNATTQTNECFRCLLVGQTSLLHKRFSNHKNQIVNNFPFNNMLQCERTYLLFHAYITYTSIEIYDFLINSSSFINTKKDKPCQNHYILRFSQHLVTHQMCNLPTNPIRLVVLG